ncbi:MAG: RIP metalloprotease RseP [Chlorobi bacterium]|nr:RIP metalloprotease RseP [Chlorobiota bacterium]
MLQVIGEVLIYAVAFILLIGILVFVHELGHFLAARWTGMRANVFAIGMGPRLFGWNKRNGFTFGKLPEDFELGDDTDYRIAAFPIGGYVKISGMVDESMDTDYAKTEPQPYEFRSKNAWQKAFVISAGVIMNILLAIVVFGGLNWLAPKELQATSKVGPLPTDSTGVAFDAGLRPGDSIVAVNGRKIATFDEIDRIIYNDSADSDITLSVNRNGAPQQFTIRRLDIRPFSNDNRTSIIPIPAYTSVKINGIAEGMPAAAAGFQPNDSVIAVDGQPIHASFQFSSYLSLHKNQEVTVTIGRGTEVIEKQVKSDTGGKIGVILGTTYDGPKQIRTMGFGQAFGQSISQVQNVVGGIFGMIGKLFSGQARLKDSVGGPVAIADFAKEAFTLGIDKFLYLLALLSISLAVMNILPVPALDGGHLVFIIVEAIIRREVPLKVRMAFQQAGFVLLLIFMAYVIFNDIARRI